MLVVPALCRHPPAMSSPLLRYRPMLCHSVPLCHRHSCSVIVPLLCQRHSTLSSSLLLCHRRSYSIIVTLFIVHLLCRRHHSSVIVTPALSSFPCSLVITVLSSSPFSAVVPPSTPSAPSSSPLLCHRLLHCYVILICRHSYSVIVHLLCHRPLALSPPPCSVIVVCSVIITPDQ